MLTSMQTADLEVSGLGSGPALRGVRSALNCIHGVVQVRMVPNRRHVTVIYDAFRVSPRQFETAVSVMGCEVEHLSVRTLPAPAVDNVAQAEACAGPVTRSGFGQG
jgi:hypothetical protein